MHQKEYSLELIAETGLSGAKPAITPIDTNTKLTTKQYDDHVNITQAKEVHDPLADQSTYQRQIGKLLNLTMTRPHIAFGVQTLRQFLQQPKQSHMEDALRSVRYIKNQPGQGVLLSNNHNTNITAYCDVDLASCPVPTHQKVCFRLLCEIGRLIGILDIQERTNSI